MTPIIFVYLDYLGDLLQLLFIFASYVYPYHVSNVCVCVCVCVCLGTPPKVPCISQVSLGYVAITNTPQNLRIMHKVLIIVHTMFFWV